MGGKTIPLSRTYDAFGAAFAAITLREPTFEDLFALGEVQEWQPVPGGVDGQLMLITHDDRIRAYAERLAGKDAGKLPLLALADAVKVKGAIIDFFAEARKSDEPPTTSPSDTGSASTSSPA